MTSDDPNMSSLPSSAEAEMHKAMSSSSDPSSIMRSSPVPEDTKKALLDLPHEALQRVIHHLVPRRVRANCVSHGKSIASYNAAAWLNEKQETHALEPYLNPAMFQAILPILMPVSNACRAMHEAVNAYVLQTDVALAGSRITSPLGYADHRLGYKNGVRVVRVHREIRGWGMPVRFLNSNSVDWYREDGDPNVSKVASTITCFAIDVDSLPLSPFELGHFPLLESVTISLEQRESAHKIATAFDVVRAVTANSAELTVRSLHLKTTFKAFKVVKHLSNVSALEGRLESFVLELSAEGVSTTPLMEVHWRWNAITAKGGIPVSDILSSLLALWSDVDFPPTWEGVLEWKLDRVCRLRAREQPGFCDKLDRLLSAPRRSKPGAFPTLDLQHMIRDDSLALGTLFVHHASSIRALNLDVHCAQVGKAFDYLDRIMRVIDRGSSVSDFSFTFDKMDMHVHGGLAECTEAVLLVTRLLSGLGKNLRYFDFSLEHIVEEVSDMLEIIRQVYDTAIRSNPEVEMLHVNLFRNAEFNLLPMGGFVDAGDLFWEVEGGFDASRATPDELELRKCQDAARVAVSRLPKLRSVSAVVLRRDPYAAANQGYSDEEFFYPASGDDMDVDDYHQLEMGPEW